MPRPRGEVTVWLVSAAAALALFGDSSLYVLLPLEQDRLGLSGDRVGILLAVNRLVRLAVNEPAGRLVGRFGARLPLAGALALAALTTWAYGGLGGATFAGFLAARCAWGFAWSLIRHAANAAVLAGPPGERGRLQGVFRSIPRLGSLAATLGGAWLVERLGFARGETILALATLPGILLALATRFPEGERAAPPSTPVPPPAGSGRSLVPVVVAAVLVNAVGGSLLQATASLRARDLASPGPDALIFGVAVGLATLGGVAGSGRWIAEILGSPVAGGLSDRLGRSPVALVGGLLAAGALAGCALARSPSGFVVAATLSFLALAALQTALDALAIDVAAPGRDATRRLGRYAMAVDVATAVGPLLGSSLAGRGLLPGAYVAAALACLGVGLAASWLERGTRGTMPA